VGVDGCWRAPFGDPADPLGELGGVVAGVPLGAGAGVEAVPVLVVVLVVV
jgi:hypothetical protein